MAVSEGMPPAATYTRTFAPLYGGSTWLTVWKAMHEMARSRVPQASVPPLTNAEVAAFVREWRDVSGSGGPLWAQFVAQAYGWSPPARPYLRRDAEQAAGAYADVEDVWRWARGIAEEMDARRASGAGGSPFIAVNRETFADPVFAGGVRAALRADGYDAKFKLPLGTCRDKSGKQRAPRPPCDRHGKGLLVGFKNGKPVYAACDNPGDCTPVVIDDPLTYAGNQVATLLFWVGVAWVVFQPRQRRRSRDT